MHIATRICENSSIPGLTRTGPMYSSTRYQGKFIFGLILDMKYDKPQKGNPHQLTVNQHTLPLMSISRFANATGRVSVNLLKQNKVIQLKPDDSLFCARRTWDQRAENGYMKNIEDKYQSLAEKVVSERQETVGPLEQSIVTDMFVLWNVRAHRKAKPTPDQRINAIDVEKHLTKDEQELLEKNHICVIRPDLIIAGRHLAGITIQMNVDKERQQMADVHWGILKASAGEFIVPDNYSNARILPLSPIICFYSQSNDDVIGIKEVAEINRLAIDSSREYYFANDFNKCPS